MVLKKLFNKEKFKGMVIGSVITLLATSPLLIFAGSESITAYLTDIKVLYNGKAVESDTKPIVYNGRTFLPVRALVNSFDKNIDWNSKTSTVVITDKVKKVEETVLPTKDIEDSKKDEVKVSPTPSPSPTPSVTPTPTPVLTPTPTPTQTPMPIEPELKNYKVLRFNNGDKYVGQVRDNKPDGLGIFYYANNDTHLGYWSNGTKSGEGIFREGNGKYIGTFQDNMLNGFGIKIKNEKFQKCGIFTDDKLNGTGMELFDNGTYYAGGFAQDVFKGLGILRKTDASFQSGYWENGVILQETPNTTSNSNISSSTESDINTTNISSSNNSAYMQEIKRQYEQELRDIQTKITNTKNEKNVRILTSNGWEWTYSTSAVRKLEEEYQNKVNAYNRWKALWNIQ